MFNENSKNWSQKFYDVAVSIVTADDPLLIADTYITNLNLPEESSSKKLLYDRKGEKFIQINNEEGEIQDTILFRNRNSFKVGGQSESKYRSLLFFNIKSYIENNLKKISGYTTGKNYSVLDATLTLTAVEGVTFQNVYSQLIALDINADESASWYTPSESHSATWTPENSIEPLSEKIVSVGTQQNADLVFNITPFVNIWLASPLKPMGIMLFGDENSDDKMNFHSQQAPSPLVGQKQQTNTVFLGAGDINTINTEGILVKIENQNPYLYIESSDGNAEAIKRWSSFNASVSIGNTFSMFLPDVNTSSQIYTLIDKRTSTTGLQLVVSGSTAGIDTTVFTSAEFSCVGTTPSGYGIVEFYSPDNSFITDASTLKSGEPIIFEYVPSIYPNNATSYTLDFYSDERNKNNRIRLYLKEQTASENRTGLPTEVRRNSIRPRLQLTLSI